jgi:hypothetical protein
LRCRKRITAEATTVELAPTRRATRGLETCEIHPTNGAPTGAVPRNPIAYRAITRPRMVASTRIWIVEFAVAMNAIDRAPIGTMNARATGSVGERATVAIRTPKTMPINVSR